MSEARKIGVHPETLPRGFRAAATRAGIKPSGGLDLAVIAADRPCTAAGTFTTNRIAAAPVKWDRARVPASGVRAIVVNSGNANAATGPTGDANVARIAERSARSLGCPADAVLVASTGVIGHQLPMDRLEVGLARALGDLAAEPERFAEAAEAILTTDTRPKVVSFLHEGGSRAYRGLGFAKGAAMIGPRMATMLAFLLTDASVDPADLQAILSEAVDDSFNCLSVEGHTSTNDTVLLLASNDGDAPPLAGPELAAFARLVHWQCDQLATMIAADAEGATHLVTIEVDGCRDREQARTIARTVADSPLVKTAIHGADPNWGRIVSAAGYSGVPFEETEVTLWLNGVELYRDGAPLPFDAAAVSANLRAHRETSIRLRFRLGEASLRFRTSDLTAEYVRLNADYTT